MTAKELFETFKQPYHAIQDEEAQREFGITYMYALTMEYKNFLEIYRDKKTAIRMANKLSNRVMKRLIAYDGRKLFKKDLIKIQLCEK